VVGDQFLCVVVTGLQHSHLQPAVDVRQASNTSLPLSGGKMLFLGVPQMLLATFNFCSVSLMIIFNYHLLFLQPTIGCLPPVATTNNNVGNDVDISKLLTSRGHHPMATFSPTNSGVDATWLTALHCHSSMQLEEKTKNNKNQLGTQRKKSKSSWAATMVLGCSIFGV